MKKYYIILICLSTLISFTEVNAYNIRQITNKDGLSNSAVVSMYQDKEGFLWIGTCDGLNMSNGIKINVFKPTMAENNLSGNLIADIAENQHNELWIHTNYGLNKLHKKDRKISSYKQFSGRYIFRQNKEHMFVLQSNSKLSYYHKKSDSFKDITPKGIRYDSILNMTISDDNALWIMTKNNQNKKYKIAYSEDGTLSLSPIGIEKNQKAYLFCLAEREDNNTLYLVDNSYDLYKYNLLENRKQYITNLEDQIKKRGSVSSIATFHNDFFIGFKSNGAIRLVNKKGSTDKYEIQDIGINVGVFYLLRDRYQDLVWIGTDGQGIYMYSLEPYSIKSSTFNNLSPKIEKPVRCLFLDKENNLWIGTKGNGILKVHNYNKNIDLSDCKLEYIMSSNSQLDNDAVYSIKRSRKDIIWIGTETGLNYYSYEKKTFKKLKLEVNNEAVKYIHSITEVGDSCIWLATVGTGLIRANIGWNGNTPYVKSADRILIGDKSFADNLFFTSYIENSNKIWFGNRGLGAFYVDEDKNNSLYSLSFDKNDKLKTLNDIFAITEDSKGNLWFGTSYGLVKYSKDKKVEYFNESNGLLNNTIHGIIEDSRENLWLSTNTGIVKFNTRTKTFQTYNHTNGLSVTEYSDGACFKDEKSRTMFFGGINGFTSITETDYKLKDFFPPINFYSISIYGEEQSIYDFLKVKDSQKIIKLDYTQKNFILYFSAIDYLNANNYSYKYMLKGEDENWINIQSPNYISFTNMAPGEYTLLLKYTDNYTGKTSPIETLKIRISPPWYQSTWAYLIYIFVLLGIISYLIKSLASRAERKKKSMLEKLNTLHKEKVYESKLQFFMNIAHEFCAPLTMIYGPSSRILSHPESDIFVKKHTQIIQKNAEKLNSLIQDLVEFRQIESGVKPIKIEYVIINDINKRVLETFSDFTKSKNITLVDNSEQIIRWNTDVQSLLTIFHNIIKNSILHFVRPDGHIWINAKTDNDKLTIEIANDGLEMKEETLFDISDKYKIIENFENNQGATDNLSMAITFDLIQMLGGTIKISYKNGKNVFMIQFSRKNTEQQVANANWDQIETKTYLPHSLIDKLPTYEIHESKPTILIVDEDIEILWLICEVFVEQYNVVPINESTFPQDYLDKHHPSIILFDITNAPKESVNFVRNMKSDKRTAHIPIILISAKQSIENQIEGLAAGAERYITKPFNLDYLKVSVDQLIIRKDILKDYFNSPLSAYNLKDGKLSHKENQIFIQKIMDTIDNNITNPDLSTQFIADKLRISTRHLSRKVNQIGIAQRIPDIIKQCRLKVACNLLINTQHSVEEIIYKSGFSNKATFFKNFTERYNCTPKEFRTKNKE